MADLIDVAGRGCLWTLGFVVLFFATVSWLLPALTAVLRFVFWILGGNV